MTKQKESSLKTVSTKTYLYLYFFAYVNHGLFACNVGSLIPYLAELLKREETEFSFLFMAGTIGTAIGIVIYKYIQKTQQNINEHKIVFYAGVITAAASIFFVFWESIFGEWITMTVIGGAGFIFITIVNICIVQIAVDNPKWVSTGHGLFGIGALLAPQLIRLLQVNIFLLNAMLFLALSILFYYIPSPQHVPSKKQEKEQDKEQEKEQEQEKENLKAKQKIKEGKQLKQGSLKLQIFFGLAFFFYVGVEMTVTGWIPSYSVLMGVKTSRQATVYCTIFWIIMTFGRLAFPYLPLELNKMIKVMVVSIVIFGAIALGLHNSTQYAVAAMITIIFFAISCSIMFPFMLSVPYEYGIKFKKEQTTNILLSTIPSTGFLVTPTGELMKFNISYMFFSLILMGIILMGLVFSIFKIMTQQVSKNQTLEQEMKETLLK